MEILEKKNNSKSKASTLTTGGSGGSPQDSPEASVVGSKASLNKAETPKASKYKVALSALKVFGSGGAGGIRFGTKDKDIASKKGNERIVSMEKTESRDSVDSRDSDSEMDESLPPNEAGADLFRNFSFTGLYQSNEIQVNVRWREKGINTKIVESMTVSATIAQIIKLEKISKTLILENGPVEENQASAAAGKIENDIEKVLDILKTKDFSGSPQQKSATSEHSFSLPDPDGFLLGKKDRQNPGMRVWFHHKAPISMYSLKQGDELILQHQSDTVKLCYIVPPLDTIIEMPYSHELTVQNAIKEMKRARNLGEQLYGLYNPRIGMWLDGTKPLVAYNLEKQILEFRALANEFLVRISLPDFDQKIGIKVLPTFLVSDVLSIITFQLLNRKLILPKQGLYGLLTPSNNQWLLETARIDHYETIKTETLVFKLQHELCNIKVNQSQFVQMLVGYTCTAGDILNLFLVNHALPLDQDYALYTRGGNVMLTEDQKVMDVLKDMTSNESIMIQMRPISVYISTPAYPGLRLPFDLDISRTLSSYVASISRKFGFSEECFLRINIEGNSKELDTEASIARIKIAHSTKLEAHWDHLKKKVNPQLSIANSIARRAREATGSSISLYSIDELIDMLTEPLKDQSSDFSNIFLLTFRKFISVEDLVRKLAIRYMALNSNDLNWTDFEAYRKPIEIRVANTIVQWIKKFPGHFSSTKIGSDNAQTVLDFVDEIVENDHPVLAKQIRKGIEKVRVNPMESDFAQRYAKDEIIDELTSNVVVFNCTPLEIAENLTIIENHYYTNINPSELLNQAWSKKDALVTAPGIIALSRRFNSVASWIVQCILDMKTPKLRAERIGKIIEVAAALVGLHNYSSLMAIIAGLNKACITRLHETQKELSSKTIKKKAELETLMSALGSYKNYRASIHKIQPPCIPYIGTYLTDLTYIEDGNPDAIDGLINFSKWEMVAKVIREVLDYQLCPYQLKSKQEVCAVLYNLPETSEAQERVFWSLSKKYEASANK